ncbi:MAG: CBS domain-containing protein, partial [Rickettsiales bacterium]|nr:CBS domain-containing protein [Rickettsiales bacterium]
DALRGAIEMHHDDGSVIKEDKDMLGSILDLPQMDVADVMVHRKNMVTIDINLPIDELIQMVLDSNYTRIPLWEENPENIVAILHVKNVLRAIKAQKKEGTQIDIKDISYEPWFVPENTSLSKQLHEFRNKRNHFALVVDEYGALQGLITLEDVLEEIVGDINDEHDTSDENVMSEKDGWYVLNGSATIRDINRQFGWNLPDDDATTIAGLIMHESETIPDTGSIFEYHNFIFDIREKDSNQITQVAIKQTSTDE